MSPPAPWPHQHAAVDAAVTALTASSRSGPPPTCLWSMPRGNGRTAAAVAAAVGLGCRTLVLVDGEHRLGPTIELVRRHEPDVTVGHLAEGGRYPDWGGKQLVVASAGSCTPMALENVPAGQFDLVILDDVDHYPPHCWDWLALRYPDAPLLGVAGPDVNAAASWLYPTFGQRVTYKYGLRRVLDEGHLPTLRQAAVTTDVALDEVPLLADGEYQQLALLNAINTPSRNALVAQAALRHGAGRRVVLVAAGDAHAW
jgi:superfamily II DNA or RNA helicase